MSCVNLDKYDKVIDKFGAKVVDWAEQTKPGHFRCKISCDGNEKSFAKGKSDLTQHSETIKHRKNGVFH